MKKKKISGENSWYNLDNAAIIYPSVSDNRNTNVFRLSCILGEVVDRATLQNALDEAMRAFRYFRVIMRRGLFWYYLESTDLAPLVRPETERPCERIFYKNIKELLFRVTYFGKRINLEVFHALADGSGAVELLRAIVYHYLSMKHADELPNPLPPLDNAAPPAHRAEDSFDRHYDPDRKQAPFKNRAWSISGTMLPANSVQIISASMPLRQVLDLAKSKGATLTAYLSALLLCSVYHGLMPRRARSRPIAVNIPVDLRGHFPSETSRNFFSVVDAAYCFENNPDDFDSVLASVSEQLRENLNPERLSERIGYNMAVQKNLPVRFVPLVIKNLVLRMAYSRAEASTTCALSNVGRITMPEEFAPFIEDFNCLLNPTGFHRLKACAASFGDRFVLNFTSCIEETNAQRYFIRHLAAQGIDITISSNGGFEDEVV